MANFDALEPEKALVYTDFKYQWDELYGPEKLVDGDMEADGTSAWTASSAAISKQGNAYSGNQCLRVVSVAAGYASQFSVMVSGRRYRLTGYCRTNGDATARADVLTLAGQIVYIGRTANTSWQYINTDFATTSTHLAFRHWYSTGYAEFDQLSLKEIARVCKNYGKAPGSIPIIKCGNGYTSTKFPSRITPRGHVLNSNTQYFDTGLIDPFSASDPFTFMWAGDFQIPATDGVLFSTMSPSPVIGINIAINSSGQLYYSASNVGWRFKRYNVLNLLKAKAFRTITVVYEGGMSTASIKFYIDGDLVPESLITVNSDTLVASHINSEKTLCLGTHSYEAAFIASATRPQTVRGVALYPYSLTQSQIKELDRRMRQTAGIPG